MTDDRDLFARWAAARGAPRSEAAPCPDPGELAAWSAGAVSDDRREALSAHVAACAPCLTTLVALEREAVVDSAPVAAPTSRWPGRALGFRRFAWGLAAAMVIAAVGLVLARRARDPVAHDPIEVAAARVHGTDAGLASSVAALTEAELAALAMEPQRGRFRVLLPQGVVLDGRPSVRVDPMPGATRYAVSVRGPDGALIAAWEAATAESPWPADAPRVPAGLECVVAVEVNGAAGRTRAVGAFRAATEAEAASSSAAARTLEGVASPAVASLLRARRALRRGELADAEASLRRAMDAPETAVEARRLAAVLAARIGP